MRWDCHKCYLFFQDWYHSYVKGCFFLEDDGSISSLQYQLHIPQTTNIYLTIQPICLGHASGTGAVSYYTWTEPLKKWWISESPIGHGVKVSERVSKGKERVRNRNVPVSFWTASCTIAAPPFLSGALYCFTVFKMHMQNIFPFNFQITNHTQKDPLYDWLPLLVFALYFTSWGSRSDFAGNALLSAW